MPFGGDPVPPHDVSECAPDDPRVKAHRTVIDVPDVHRQALVPADGVATVDLGPPGEAGADLVTAGLLR
jgi:hypothetical protein